jgi:cysteine-rich repeat protein
MIVKKDTIECDDGNLISGDGCSSNCTIEKNFNCSGGNNTKPDICWTIKPITASIQTHFKDNSLLTLVFDREILPVSNPTRLIICKIKEFLSTDFTYKVT